MLRGEDNWSTSLFEKMYVVDISFGDKNTLTHGKLLSEIEDFPT